MSNVSTVGTDASQLNGELHFQAYQKLLMHKEKVDREILKLQGKMFKAFSRRNGTLQGQRVKYVPRLKNTTTLSKAILKCMKPNNQMTTDDVISSLNVNKFYDTDSDYFYTMVNNKLNCLKRDKKIKKTSRGVFEFRPRSRRKLAMA